MRLSMSKFVALGLGLATMQAAYSQEEEAKPKKAEVIRVTGSRIKQVDLETSGAMTVFSRDQIEKSGYANIADFLRSSIPSGSMTTENSTLSQVGGSSSFGGRDFGAEYTLTLLNGRRLPINAIASDFVDINLIPIAAIERIEYLTDGASAIYGSDAVAGVLNIITRKSFDGVSFSSRYGEASQGDGVETSWQVVGGTSSDRSNFLISADSFRRTSIKAIDRPLIKSAIAPDGTDARSPNGLPGYVILNDGSIEAFPDCPTEDLDGAGRCQYDYGKLYEAVPFSERQNIFTVFDYQINEDVKFFGEARYSQGLTMAANGAAPGGVTLSADAPSNTYGEEIFLVRRYLDFGPRRTEHTNRAFSTVGGFSGNFGADHNWSLEVSRHNLRNLQIGAGGQINEPAVVEAFNSGVLDPFSFNVFDTEEKMDAYNDINTTTFREGTSVLQTYNLAVDGIIPVELPGGDIGYATGYEFRQEKFQDRADNLSKGDKILGSASSDGKGDRENTAFYAEFQLPVLSNLDVNTAVRLDNIDGKTDATTYKLGLTYSPLDILKLRASAGTGFKAPNMHDLFLGQSFGVLQATDAATCGDTQKCEINVVTGGNEELEPEESVSFNLGVISQLTSSVSLSADYWDITIENKVSELSLQSILNDEGKYGNLINRDSNGRLNTTGAFVETNLQNLTKEHSAGVEVQVKYSDSFDFGRLTTALHLNKLVKSETQETATDPLCNYADEAGVDGRLALGWALDSFGADMNVRYYGASTSYSGGVNSGTCDKAEPETKFAVEATSEVDLQVSYVSPFDTSFAVGVNNLTDAEPAYDKNETWPWYSQDRYSNIGQFVYVSATHEFK